MFEAKAIAIYRAERCLLRNINMRLSGGECLQIVGENGTGKTSLLHVLAGLLPPTEGSITWQTDSLFFFGHRVGLYDRLTVLENLQLDENLQGIAQSAIQQQLATIGLGEQQDLLVRQLSEGQKQRVVWVKLFFSRAKLFILDEPFSALDSQIIPLLQQWLLQKLQNNCAVVFTSHRPLTDLAFPIQPLNLMEQS